MAQVFSRRADRIAMAVVAVVAVAAVAVLLRLAGVIPPGLAAATPEAPDQPRPFTHAHHAGEIGIACQYCHTAADEGPEAGYPPVETCAGCHLSTAGRPDLPPPLAWTRVVAVPDHVFFHHGAHVRAGIGCAACHGAVETMERMREPQPFTMRFCLDCHRSAATAAGIDPYRLTNCSVCHR